MFLASTNTHFSRSKALFFPSSTFGFWKLALLQLWALLNVCCSAAAAAEFKFGGRSSQATISDRFDSDGTVHSISN